MSKFCDTTLSMSHHLSSRSFPIHLSKSPYIRRYMTCATEKVSLNKLINTQKTYRYTRETFSAPSFYNWLYNTTCTFIRDSLQCIILQTRFYWVTRLSLSKQSISQTDKWSLRTKLASLYSWTDDAFNSTLFVSWRQRMNQLMQKQESATAKLRTANFLLLFGESYTSLPTFFLASRYRSIYIRQRQPQNIARSQHNIELWRGGFSLQTN
jgi:hypothetical protein